MWTTIYKRSLGIPVSKFPTWTRLRFTVWTATCHLTSGLISHVTKQLRSLNIPLTGKCQRGPASPPVPQSLTGSPDYQAGSCFPEGQGSPTPDPFQVALCNREGKDFGVRESWVLILTLPPKNNVAWVGPITLYSGYTQPPISCLPNCTATLPATSCNLFYNMWSETRT